MFAFKGFEQDLTCRGFRYVPGRTFKLGEGKEPELCSRGFHACILPIQVLRYYGCESQDVFYFVYVDKLAKIDKSIGVDSKICGGEIMIGEESIHDVVTANIEVVDAIWRTIPAECCLMTPVDDIKHGFALYLLQEARGNLKKRSVLDDTNLALCVTDGFWRGLCMLHDSLGETSAYGDFNHFLELMTWKVKELFR